MFTRTAAWAGRRAHRDLGRSPQAFVLRDYDAKNEFNGLSVHKAVHVVETIIAPALLGMDAADQRAIDQRMLELDGTENKERLGGNSIYSVSIACLRAAAAAHKMPVYRYLERAEC